jgi:hypothetical protein
VAVIPLDAAAGGNHHTLAVHLEVDLLSGVVDEPVTQTRIGGFLTDHFTKLVVESPVHRRHQKDGVVSKRTLPLFSGGNAVVKVCQRFFESCLPIYSREEDLVRFCVLAHFDRKGRARVQQNIDLITEATNSAAFVFLLDAESVDRGPPAAGILEIQGRFAVLELKVIENSGFQVSIGHDGAGARR